MVRDALQPASVPNSPHPDAAEVARTVARGYGYASLSAVKPVVDFPPSPDGLAQRWNRQFDGVDIMGPGAVTVWHSGAWETRWQRELHEPMPVRRVAVISDARARARAGLKPGSRVKMRLVYLAIFKQLHKVPHPTNAMDVENVIDCYRLSIEMITSDLGTGLTVVLVDAYTGDIVHRVHHPDWIGY